MAYYNANLVVKLTRKAMKITQEELSDGICHTVSLSRIENEHHIVKREIYRKLMEKMGRMPEKHYAVCISKDGELMEEKIEVERAFKRYDYEAAEKHLQKMKERADDNLLTRQYIVRREALVDYYLKRIGEDELIEQIDRAIRMTVPEYEKYIDKDKVFPFTKDELLMLMSLGSGNRRMGEMEKCLQLYEIILQCLDVGYMGYPDKTTLQITVRRNRAKTYEAKGRYEDALEEISDCLQLAIRNGYNHPIATLLAIKAFNIIKLVESKVLSEEKLGEAKKNLRQAYYIAAARGDDKVVKVITQYCKSKNLKEKCS